LSGVCRTEFYDHCHFVLKYCCAACAVQHDDQGTLCDIIVMKGFFLVPVRGIKQHPDQRKLHVMAFYFRWGKIGKYRGASVQLGVSRVTLL